jgi:hypothetical protein
LLTFLTEKLLPLLVVNAERQEETRVVSVTSAAESFAHLKPEIFLAQKDPETKNKQYNGNDEYSNSKLAIQMFNLDLAHLFDKYDVSIKSVTAHPGMVPVERPPQS